MIDLNALHSMAGNVGYYNFSGNTNDAGDFVIEFYEHSNFKGNHFWLVMVGDDQYDVDFTNAQGRFTYDGISENEVFLIIKNEV